MADEQLNQDQRQDQDYLNGFNLGYFLQELIDKDNLVAKDQKLLDTITKSLNSLNVDSDKILGIKDGQEMCRIHKDITKSKEDPLISRSKRHTTRDRGFDKDELKK